MIKLLAIIGGIWLAVKVMKCAIKIVRWVITLHTYYSITNDPDGECWRNRADVFREQSIN